MRNDWVAVMKLRSRFIKALETALIVDQQNNFVDSLAYEYNLETGNEILSVIFRTGQVKKILVNKCSNERILREVVKTVYG